MALKIAITGSSGLVGTRVASWFEERGDTVIPCVRQTSGRVYDRPVIRWDVASHDIDFQNLEGCDVLIHLAGANISQQKWTPAFKDEIRESRLQGTRLIAQALARLTHKPKVFLCASAIGYYGDAVDGESFTEQSPAGSDFLADVCAQWEKETNIASAAGIRTVNMRLGVVLDRRGGALARMLPIFRSGFGGTIGSGKQMVSWIALDDIPRVMAHLIDHNELQGPVNVVSPNAVSNRELTKTLAQTIKRPAVFPVPAFVLRSLYGEMADALLLSSSRVVPEKLTQSGFDFEFSSLAEALQHILISDV